LSPLLQPKYINIYFHNTISTNGVDTKLDHKELEDRLGKLGVDIKLSTLREWAREGIIESYTTYFKKTHRGIGRNNIKTSGKPGRFTDWPEEILESAAAVYMIRNRCFPPLSPREFNDLLTPRVFNDRYWSHITRGKRSVRNKIIKLVRQQANDLLTVLATDCKKASSLFRTCLYPEGYQSQEGIPIARTFGHLKEDTLHPLVAPWILAVEKVRHKIALDESIGLRYNWVIEEDGRSEFQGLDVLRQGSTKIELNVIHLKPLENGYSRDYGFPQIDILVDLGFVDVFELSERGALREGFRVYSDGSRTGMYVDRYQDFLYDTKYDFCED